jgi:Flp pilus assembly pilin Flp
MAKSWVGNDEPRSEELHQSPCTHGIFRQPPECGEVSQDYIVSLTAFQAHCFRVSELTQKEIMSTFLLDLVGIAKTLLTREEGQSMTEYALLVALISFGCVAGEAAVANSVNHTFISLATTITAGVERQ